jgi:formylglycine-generating enzyme required for sulfatase activity
MLGNVREMCADWYYAYPKGAMTDPTGPRESVGDGSPGEHVLRGGCWNSIVRYCRSAARDYSSHEYCFRNATIGFRVVMDEAPAKQAKP